MEILVTNDDGILAPGIWRLAKDLQALGRVIIVAPDREQSGFGTAITLRRPLRVQKVTPLVPDIEAYSVDGTPTDSAMLALGKIFTNPIDIVVSGVNSGPNLGDDVLLSGTVGAALNGYLHGCHALAVSLEAIDDRYLGMTTRFAQLLAKRIIDKKLKGNVFLNVNLPARPLEEIEGIRLTRLASKSHINSVEEGNDGRHAYYWLIRQKIDQVADRETDIWAIEKGYISITALHSELLNQPAPVIDEGFFDNLFEELKTAD